MPPKPGELQNNGWLPVDPNTGNSIPWAEAINASGPMTEAHFSYEEDSYATMPLWFYWSDLSKAIGAILGTNTFDGTNINRTLPIQHPLFPQLWAEKIVSIKSYKFTGKDRKNSLNVPASYVATAKLALVVIAFTQPKFNMLSDAQLDVTFPPVGGARQEWMRFIEHRIEPAGEVISREGGSFTFVEGAGGNAPTANTTKFTQTAGESLLKPTFHWLWRRIPENGLFAKGGLGLPENILDAVGTVNDAVFPPAPAGAGYQAGTLLLLPPRFIPRPNPLPKDVGIGGIANTFQTYYDVDLPILYWNPPRGGATYGHNLFPWQDGQWYLAKDSKTLTYPLFKAWPFDTIFKLQS